MSRPKITIHNVTTGKTETREMDNAELVQYEIDQANILARKQTEAETETAKATLLNRLGIKPDEAKLLLS